MSNLALEGKRYEFHGLKLPVLSFFFLFFFFLLFPFLFSRVAVCDSCVTPYHDASDRCNRQFDERKGIEMKVTSALQRNRFLRIVGNYNVPMKINGGISRGQSMGKGRGRRGRLWNLNRKEEIQIFFPF